MAEQGRWQCPDCVNRAVDAPAALDHQLAAHHAVAEWLPRRKKPQRVAVRVPGQLELPFPG